MSFSQARRTQGEQFARDGGQWEFHARALLSGAEACRERYHHAVDALKSSPPTMDLMLGSISTYLCAQAIEVLLKALAVQKTPELVDRNEMYTHDLVALAEKHSDVVLSVDEQLMLGKCRTLIEWAGRYPVPRWTNKKHEFDVPDRRTADGQVIIDVRELPGVVDWAAVRLFASRVQSLFYERGGAQRRVAT